MKQMTSAKDHEYWSVLAPHLTSDQERSADFCYDVLVQINKEIANRNQRNKMIGSFTQALSGSILARIVERVLMEDTFGKGRIHAVARMGYYLVSSAVLVDFFFSSRPEMPAFVTLVKSYSKAEVVDIIKFVARNFEKPEVAMAPSERGH